MFYVRVPRLNLRQVVGREEDERPDYTLIFDERHSAQSSSRFAYNEVLLLGEVRRS